MEPSTFWKHFISIVIVRLGTFCMIRLAETCLVQMALHKLNFLDADIAEVIQCGVKVCGSAGRIGLPSGYFVHRYSKSL